MREFPTLMNESAYGWKDENKEKKNILSFWEPFPLTSWIAIPAHRKAHLRKHYLRKRTTINGVSMD